MLLPKYAACQETRFWRRFEVSDFVPVPVCDELSVNETVLCMFRYYVRRALGSSKRWIIFLDGMKTVLFLQ
jgi:hypothetical protein